MKFFKNLKKNNKGFSLVELIIVIAIMAVLVGTLAPQYIRYVEKSRVAADETTIDNFTSALEVLAASTDANLSTGSTYSIVFSSSNSYTATYSGFSGDAETVFKQLIDTTATYKLQSSTYKSGTTTIALAYDTTNKIWKVSTTTVASTSN